MWLCVLTSRKIAIYSDRDIIIIIEVFRFKLVLHWLCWYFVGSYPLTKYWWKIKVVEKNEDVVRFCTKGLMAAWSKGVYTDMLRGLIGKKEGRKLLESII